MDWAIVPWMESLICGSPRTLSPSALVEIELPAVARPAAAGVVSTGLSGPPVPTGTSASVKLRPRLSPPPLARSSSVSPVGSR